MNAQEVRQTLEAAGFVYTNGASNDDMTVHFDSADAGKTFQGYVDSHDGEHWLVILLGQSWVVGEVCTTPDELTYVFQNIETLLQAAKAERNAK